MVTNALHHAGAMPRARSEVRVHVSSCRCAVKSAALTALRTAGEHVHQSARFPLPPQASQRLELGLGGDSLPVGPGNGTSGRSDTPGAQQQRQEQRSPLSRNPVTAALAFRTPAAHPQPLQRHGHAGGRALRQSSCLLTIFVNWQSGRGASKLVACTQVVLSASTTMVVAGTVGIASACGSSGSNGVSMDITFPNIATGYAFASVYATASYGAAVVINAAGLDCGDA